MGFVAMESESMAVPESAYAKFSMKIPNVQSHRLSQLVCFGSKKYMFFYLTEVCMNNVMLTLNSSGHYFKPNPPYNTELIFFTNKILEIILSGSSIFYF